MNDEEVGGTVEGDDLTFHLIAESSTEGQDASDREILAVGARLRSHRSIAFGPLFLSLSNHQNKSTRPEEVTGQKGKKRDERRGGLPSPLEYSARPI